LNTRVVESSPRKSGPKDLSKQSLDAFIELMNTGEMNKSKI